MGIHLGGEVNNLVFEGAQGLLLDEEHYFFPHVTRSKTGLNNVLDICRQFEIKEADATYVTRAYMTRHGQGPFPSEEKELKYEDKTNVTNEFQGSLRFGSLDVDLTSKAIRNDLILASDRFFEHTGWEPIKVNPSIAITCLDQVGKEICVYDDGERFTLNDVNDLVDIFVDKCNIHDFYTSYGPTRAKISPLCVGK